MKLLNEDLDLHFQHPIKKKNCRQKALRNIVKQLEERYEGLECNGKVYRYTNHIPVQGRSQELEMGGAKL